MLFNFQGPIRCRFRRQLRYYITHSFHCQHLSAIFFSNLPRPRVFWVKLSTFCGKCTALVPFAAHPYSALPLCVFPHKIRAFCTTKAAFLCGKRQIVGRFLSNAVFDNKKPASGGTQVFCLFWILKDSIVILITTNLTAAKNRQKKSLRQCPVGAKASFFTGQVFEAPPEKCLHIYRPENRKCATVFFKFFWKNFCVGKYTAYFGDWMRFFYELGAKRAKSLPVLFQRGYQSITRSLEGTASTLRSAIALRCLGAQIVFTCAQTYFAVLESALMRAQRLSTQKAGQKSGFLCVSYMYICIYNYLVSLKTSRFLTQ